MTTAVIGATGRVGSEIVRGLLARGDAVTALVRDPGKARRAFGEPGGLHIRATRLDDPRDLTGALDGIRTVFIAMGSTGIEGVLQRIAINAAAAIPSIEQVTRLSVLNTSADSLGINQRAHYSIDQFAASTAVPYSTIRPAIFSASLLAAAPQVRASRTWTGLADDPEHLDDRARPAVRDDQRQRVLVPRLNVDEVDAEPVDLGRELRQRVQFRLAFAPVVIGRPVARQLLQHRQLHALRPIADQFLVRPPRRRDACTQRLDLRLGNLDRERPDRRGTC